jgi:nucleotide-binding universal stress UspA family protein
MTSSSSALKDKKPATQSVMGRVKASHPRILRLLVPLDFSGKSRQALRYALPIAQKFAARIVLLHVIATTGKASTKPAAIAELDRKKQAAATRLDDMAAKLLPKNLHQENQVRTGIPAEEILKLSNRLNIDMIVLAPHGRSGLKRIFLGSTAEQVMRQATCPVLSVRRH